MKDTKLEQPPQPPEQPLCRNCGKPRDDSTMHFEAPGDNWGAALHSFKPEQPSRKQAWDEVCKAEMAEGVYDRVPEQPSLVEAVRKLYYAGVWHCDRQVDESTLWTVVRDAAGFEPGHSPKPVNQPSLARAPSNAKEWLKHRGLADLELVWPAGKPRGEYSPLNLRALLDQFASGQLQQFKSELEQAEAERDTLNKQISAIRRQFCEVHQPEDDATNTECSRCLAVHEQDLRKAAEARLQQLEGALQFIRDKSPDDADVESWKMLARMFKERAKAALTPPAAGKGG